MSENCRIDRTGARHSDQCNLSHLNGDKWVRTAKRIRKIVVHKNKNSKGREVCRLYKPRSSKPSSVTTISPGFKGAVYFGGPEDWKVEIETKGLKRGESSQFYAHVEWFS